MKAIPYGRQSITPADIDAVVQTLQSDYLTQGPRIAEFEQKFAEYVGARYSVAVCNATAALHLAARVLGAGPGSKVITTPITFCATANSVLYCGGDVVFADIDPATYLLDINSVRALLESSPRGTYSGIIPVDLAGYPVDREAFRALADEYGLWMILDACHAPGAAFTDSTGTRQQCGNGAFADVEIFSFHPVKHIATGEGGMITTNRKDLYDALLALRTHGITKDPALMQENHGGWFYEMQDLGYNYRMPDILAALGVSQLDRAAEGLQRRRAIAARYEEAFRGTSVRTVPATEGIDHGYHLYIVQVDNRAGLYNHLREHNVFAQVHYIPVHTLPYYRQFGWKQGDFPIAEQYYEHCLSLPMYPTLTDEEQDYVIARVMEFVQAGAYA